MSPRLPIDWDATFLGDLPEDPGTSGYLANCGVSGGARILGQVSQKGSIPVNKKPRRHLFRRHRYCFRLFDLVLHVGSSECRNTVLVGFHLTAVPLRGPNRQQKSKSLKSEIVVRSGVFRNKKRKTKISKGTRPPPVRGLPNAPRTFPGTVTAN